MAFSASQAALEGFRLVGRRPVSFTVWALLPGAVLAALSLAGAWLFQRQFPEALGESRLAPDQVAGFVGGVLVALLAGMIAILAYVSVINCAIYRAVLQPARRGFAYLRFGRAEWNMFLLMLLMFLAAMAFELAGVVVGVGIYAAPLVIAAKVSLIALEVFVLLALLLIVAVRWSLAGPIIVAEGRLDLGRSWSLTRRHALPLVGLFLLAGALGFVVSIVVQLITRSVSIVLFDLFQSPPEEPHRMFVRMWGLIAANPGLAAGVTVLLLLAVTLQTVVQLAPVAAAYREIVAET